MARGCACSTTRAAASWRHRRSPRDTSGRDRPQHGAHGGHRVAGADRGAMSILAIDTSSRRRGLCVAAARDGALLDHRALTGRHLDRELPPALAALLRDDLDAVACVMGPGSYTGLRVGIAAALGLAH